MNSDIGHKAQTGDSDSSDKIVVPLAEKNNNSADATDYNYTWAAPVAGNAKDSCISVIGRSVEGCRDS